MTHKSSQRKGRRAELELSHLLQEKYGYNTRPGSPLNFGTEPDVSGLPGLHLESKRAEKIELPKWIKQAEHDAQAMNDGIPCVVFRQNHQPWRICMTLDDFMKFYHPACNSCAWYAEEGICVCAESPYRTENRSFYDSCNAFLPSPIK